MKKSKEEYAYETRAMELGIKQAMLEAICTMENNGKIQESELGLLNERVVSAINRKYLELTHNSNSLAPIFFKALKNVFEDKTSVLKIVVPEDWNKKLRYKDLALSYYRSANCSEIFENLMKRHQYYKSYVNFLNSSNTISETEFNEARNFIARTLDCFYKFIPTSLKKEFSERWAISPNKGLTRLNKYGQDDYMYPYENSYHLNELEEKFEEKAKTLTLALEDENNKFNLKDRDLVL